MQVREGVLWLRQHQGRELLLRHPLRLRPQLQVRGRLRLRHSQDGLIGRREGGEERSP